MSNTKSETELELKFLRFFYEKVRPCLGPADSDIIDNIKKEFVKKVNKLPSGYELEMA